MMDNIIHDVSLNLDYFILMFLRITALIVTSPLFGRKNIPNMMKIGFCIVLTYVLFVAYPVAPAIEYQNLLGFVLLCIKELLFGLVLGYVTNMFFSLTQTAGYVIDMQMGFGMVNVLDMQNNISVPITGNFLNMILLLSFFGVNGHHQLIYIMKTTIRNFPVGSITLSPKIGWTALEVFVLAFVLAVNVAMPMIASGLLGELIMGFVVRTVPQMNMFVVGIPLKVLLGLLMLLLVMPIYVSFTNVIFQNMYAAIDKILLALAGAA
ncbi:MAG: flagellar biosynthetic protein FliR [Christensenellales bacterium]